MNTLEDSTNQISTLRNRINQRLFPLREEYAAKLLKGTDSNRRGITIRPVLDGVSIGPDADLLELWLRNQDLTAWAEEVAFNESVRSYELETLHGGIAVGRTKEALAIQAMTNETVAKMPEASALRRVYDDARSAGQRAADIVESEVDRLNRVLTDAGYRG